MPAVVMSRFRVRQLGTRAKTRWVGSRARSPRRAGPGSRRRPRSLEPSAFASGRRGSPPGGRVPEKVRRAATPRAIGRGEGLSPVHGASDMNSVLRHLRRAALLGGGAGLTDGQLLEGFLARRDEAAFEARVDRKSVVEGRRGGVGGGGR